MSDGDWGVTAWAEGKVFGHARAKRARVARSNQGRPTPPPPWPPPELAPMLFGQNEASGMETIIVVFKILRQLVMLISSSSEEITRWV